MSKTMSKTMSKLIPTITNKEIRKGLNLLGLNLSDSELNESKIGDTILLEDRTLGEIGSVFILAAALSAANLGQKKITFQDLYQAMIESESSSGYGIPIYCWQDNFQNNYCIYLTLIKGKPAIRTSYSLLSN